MSKVVIFYKTGKAHSGPYNHYGAGGLAANAMHTVGVLRNMGIDASLQPVKNYGELFDFLTKNKGITHAIIEAVWLTAVEADTLALSFTGTQIVVRAHSKMGFLQVEPEAISVIRDVMKIGERRSNLHFSSNNEEFCRSLAEVYGGKVVYLPNLYDLEAAPKRQKIPDNTLRIASFGATRLLKCHPSAALAALQIAKRTGYRLEFYINVDSTPGGDSVRRTIKAMFDGLPWAKVVEIQWQDSDKFKETVASMDLLLQLSATETFNLVTADAVASGVPAVVGPAIAWLPEQYHADIDDTSEVAELGVDTLVNEGYTVLKQVRALMHFVEAAKKVWADYLNPKRKRHWRFWE